MRSKETAPYLNPYAGGVLLGIVLFLAFFLTGNGLGASGGINRLLVFVQDLFFSEHASFKYSQPTGKPVVVRKFRAFLSFLQACRRATYSLALSDHSGRGRDPKL